MLLININKHLFNFVITLINEINKSENINDFIV